MNTYSMAQVETLTGIKGHTLRVWERRYNFLKPDRTETNIRFYSDSELRKLLNINILINNGFRVSKIDKMNEDEIHQVVLEVNAGSSAKYDDDLNSLVLAMIELNEDRFNSIFQRHITSKGLLSTVMNLLYPFLNHVGALWTANKAIPAHEHFISNLIRQKIISAIDMIPPAKEGSPVVIMFLPENEDHEIALLLANYISQDLGFKVYYLGQNVPIGNIMDVHEIANADVLFTMFITPMKKNVDLRFKKEFGNMNLPVFISGNYLMDDAPENFDYITNPEMLVEKLKKIQFKKQSNLSN